MATIHIGMFSKMEKAIFQSAIFTQGGIFWKSEKSWIIATHPKPQKKLIMAGKLCG